MRRVRAPAVGSGPTPSSRLHLARSFGGQRGYSVGCQPRTTTTGAASPTGVRPVLTFATHRLLSGIVRITLPTVPPALSSVDGQSLRSPQTSDAQTAALTALPSTASAAATAIRWQEIGATSTQRTRSAARSWVGRGVGVASGAMAVAVGDAVGRGAGDGAGGGEGRRPAATTAANRITGTTSSAGRAVRVRPVHLSGSGSGGWPRPPGRTSSGTRGSSPFTW